VLIVIGDATAAPGRRDALVAAAQAVAAAARADGGCIAYSFAADLENPDRILNIEVWADRTALDEHMTHDHTRGFLRALPDLLAREPVMSLYEVR
jgi:quinol monooxygenase YgiN